MAISSFHILFILSLSFTCLQFNDAIDRISPAQSLSGNQTIISQGGMFALGFFRPGKTSNYYIGIWPHKIPQQKIVWVANREAPLPSNSSELKISKDGNLVLLNHYKLAVWSTNLTSPMPNSTVAVLLDTGNLVLRDGSNSSAVLWQSFDHPTDTWLARGKIGLNKVTGQEQKLVSWRNSEDPSPGIYSYGNNGTNTFYMKWNSSKQYWSSGAWNGQTFGSLPESTALVSNQVNKKINFTMITDEKESYFTVTVNDTSLYAAVILDFSTGQHGFWEWWPSVQKWILIWSGPADQCEVYSICGAFGSCNVKSSSFCTCLPGFEPKSLKDWNLGDRSGGCVRKTVLNCGRNASNNTRADRFLKIPGMEFADNPQSLTATSVGECELACLNNCSCIAYAYAEGCSIWAGELLNLRQLSDGGQGGDLYLRLAASDVAKSRKNKGKIIAGIIGAFTGAGLLLFCAWLLVMRPRGMRPRGMRFGRVSKEFHGSLVPFSYGDLQSATKNFSQKLGQGSFGSVFKGTLPNSTAIAVKKLEGFAQREKEFRMEVNTIGVIQHVNLVRLRGFCSEGSKRLLVYEYMSNGSLDSHLFQSKSVLDWKKRYRIALGTARALAYLHEKCRDCIIHCDIKPENILLDVDFCPKVADFGLAKLFGHEFSKVLTTVRGTIGYLAPEWISGLPITTKADVYSYGMMLLEIISGMRNSGKSYEGNVVYFPVWAAIKLSEGDVESILDSRLHGDADLEELSRACRAACWCIQSEEASRPSMGQVVQILEGVVEAHIPPVPSLLQSLVEYE